MYIEGTRWQIGSNSLLSFWNDCWCKQEKLRSHLEGHSILEMTAFLLKMYLCIWQHPNKLAFFLFCGFLADLTKSRSYSHPILALCYTT